MRRLLQWLAEYFRCWRGESQIAISGRDPVTGERWQYVEGEDALDTPGVVTLKEPPDDLADPFSRRPTD
jgi:hypothetical protein